MSGKLLDREDIFALSRAIDDILDYAYSTVDEMQVLHVTPNPHLQRMVSLLRDAAQVHLAMLRLKDHPGVAKAANIISDVVVKMT